MIKIVLLFALFSACVYLGFNTSEAYLSKQCFYEDISNFCKFFKNEVSFTKSDLTSICDKKEYKSSFEKVKQSIVGIVKSGKIIDQNLLNEVFDKYNFLNDNDKKILSDIFLNLGQVGYNEQIEKLNYNIIQTDEQLEDYKKKSSKMMPLCKKMGFLIGLLVCIVLI